MSQKKYIPDKDGRVFHMWEPLGFNIGESYDYRRTSVIPTVRNICLRSFGRVVLTVLNTVLFGFKIVGRENLVLAAGQGVVSICNHIHPFDCTMVDLAMSDRRMYYLSLEDNFKIPLIRRVIRTLGAVPVSKNPKKLIRLFGEMSMAMDEDCAGVQIYPEGVMYPYYRGLRKFNDGAFRLAYDSGMPILPMAITKHRPTGLLWYKHKPCLHLNILEPIYPDLSIERTAAVTKLRRECERAMSDCLYRGEHEECEVGENTESLGELKAYWQLSVR